MECFVFLNAHAHPAGFVHLVGAGPGDPDLITRRGLSCLRRADVVLHDALVAPELLAEARAGAEVLAVGKRGYCVGSTRQEHIHELMIGFAREGKVVCRLKGGDPCVFGRGGEEAEALAAAGVPFDIVPGVTTAVGACAAAFIPLTHRECGQTVALVSGHHDPDGDGCTLDWPALARMETVVFYMALRHVGKIAAKLVAAGLSEFTPAAVIENATTPRQRVIAGELHDLARLTGEAHVEAPALIVVGDVVRYRQVLLGASALDSAFRILG